MCGCEAGKTGEGGATRERAGGMGVFIIFKFELRWMDNFERL
jgi:hypothetical protein